LAPSASHVSSLQAGQECLRLIKDRIVIDHIVTIDPGLAARVRVAGYADFRGLGSEVHHLHTYSMKDSRDRQLVRDLAPDLMIVNGWNRLIPSPILDIPWAGCVGFHGSWKPLPFGRGRSPVTWAILNDATEFYLHLFYLDEGIDSGDVIDTMRFDLTPDDSGQTVLATIAKVSASMLLTNVGRILDGTAPRRPQTGTATYLPKRKPEEGLIDWTMPVKDVVRLVRKFSCSPSARGRSPRCYERGGKVSTVGIVVCSVPSGT
jgi:methionyl-tRNA formyltransferase